MHDFKTVTIQGGVPLTGTVEPIPNKNSVVAVLPLTLLTDKTCTLRNIPKSTDVLKILEMLKKLGAKVDDSDFSCLKINCADVNEYTVDKELGAQIRSSILFAGPLLARFSKAEIPLPGGCDLGTRSIAAHIDSFKKANITVKIKDNCAVFTCPQKIQKNYKIWQWEASVTATENIAAYAAGTDAQFTITDAACEPHVASVLETLEQMGAIVNGMYSNRVTITGKTALAGFDFTPQPDFVDVAGYIVAAALTNGEIRIKNANNANVISGLIQTFEKFGISVKADKKDLLVKRGTSLKIDTVSSGIPLAAEGLPKFIPRPWPGFPVDVLPVIATLACKTNGRILLQNWMYESGLDFVQELNKIGANIFVCDPQRVIVTGPVVFKGGEIYAPKVIQACKALFLAALCDDSKTVIHNLEPLKRRYPDILTIYKSLGARIS